MSIQSVTQCADAVNKPSAAAMTARKILASKIAAKMEAAHLKKGRVIRMKSCSDTLVYEYCPECGKYHTVIANLCRDRLCPVCAWKLSTKRYYEMRSVLDCLDGYVYLFLTLTIRNVPSRALAPTLGEMSAAWNRLASRKTWKDIVYGWARSLEITYNKEANTFHPHYHVILAIPVSYDFTCSGLLSQIARGWRETMRLDYEPICDLRLCYNKREGEDTAAAAALEAVKYYTKHTELLDMPLAEFKTFSRAIGGRRLINFGGVFKATRARLGFTETDQPEEDVRADGCPSCSGNLQREVLRWSGVQLKYVPEVEQK